MKNLQHNTILLRALTILCLMMASVGAWAQTYYVFYNGTYGYLVNNGTNNVGLNTTFSPSAVWIANGTLGTTSRNIRSYVDESKYMNGTTGGAFTLGSSSSVWRMANNYLQLRSGSSYYVKYSGTAFTMNSTQNNGNRFTVYAVDNISDVDPSLSSFTISGGTDEMTATGSSPAFNHGTSTYTPQRTNYHFNNADHYVDGTTATVTYAWALSGIESTYAEVDNAGKVTYKTLIPERERTATLTCTATAGGLTQTATTTIKFVNPNALYTPVISYDNAAGGRVAVSLSYPESDPEVKLYYTTDGSTPSSSSTLYTGTFEVASNTTVKVIAVKGATTSGVVSEVVTTISTGVSGGKVVLDDREDHNWTYYQPNGGVDASYAYPDQLCSPYPRNVKITYYGNGNTVSTSADANPATNTFTASTNNTVAVSRYETEDTYIYYKTLEREGNTGRFPYELIPNPFSKRPVYTGTGSSDTNKWRGFYGWRIKTITSGTVHSAATGGTQYNVGSIITDEYATLYFQPTNNAKTNANNATSMTVEFEAVWARAYRVASNANAVNTAIADATLVANSYERNFVVVNTGTGGAAISNNNQKPVTVMMIEPDGSTDYRTADRYIATTTTDIIARNTLKIEWCNIRARYISANGKDMVLGRGITYNSGSGSYGTPGTTNSASYVSGIGDVANTTGTNYTADVTHKTRIESGVYGDLNYTSRTGQGLRGYISSTVYQYAILGNDYERANKNGKTLSGVRLLIKNHVSQGVGGTAATFNNNNHANASRKTFDLVIKSGYVGTDYDTNIASGAWDANYEQVVYIGVSTSTRTPGYRTLTLEGGNIAGIAGGVDRWGTSSETGRDYNATRPSAIIRLKGSEDYPVVRGPIYAGAANAPTYGIRSVIATGGLVKGWVAGGCNGNDNQQGRNFGPSYVYIGGNTHVDSNNANTTFGAGKSIGGMVYAAGSGQSSNDYSGRIVWDTHLAIADDSYIERNAFGGGNYGYSDEATYIYISGGHVKGKVFGGANLRGGKTIDIVMSGGQIDGGLYGGSNENGTISDNIRMYVFGGQVGLPSAPANIHGGGYGQPTRTSQNIDINIGLRDNNGITSGDAVIYGDVYGGSALGYVNGETATTTYHTNVTLNAGTINGSLYGGGLGNASNAANVYGPVAVKVYGGMVNTTSAAGSGAVYGANNINGAPQRSVTVDIYGTDPAPSADAYALDAVYGGGNQANYTYGNGYPTVTVHNCDNSIGYVYGGGNAAAVQSTDVTIYGGDKIGNVFGGGNGQVKAANVNGNTNVKIYGGTIGDVYGGSNTQGTIGGTINVNVNAQAEGGNAACPIDIDNVYGGGNQANSKAGTITIGCAEHIGAVYGGANRADITGNITLNINSGHIDNVFGGNNNSGNISGSITVNVNDNGSACGMLVGNVYGGGNKAPYTGSPTVNFVNGTSTGSVFGGGLGKSAVVVGNPTVNIGSWTAGSVVIGGDVFGGGDLAAVEGPCNITIRDCNTLITGDLYGGGNAAPVFSTNTTMWGGLVMGNVFGGGNGKDAALNAKGAQVGYQRDDLTAGTGEGKATTKIYGGTVGTWTGASQDVCTDGTGGVFGGSNTNGNIRGGIALTLDQQPCTEPGATQCSLKLREIYGAGNEAAYAGTGINFDLGCVDYLEQIYGGAKAADLDADAVLTIRSGHFKKVFGGNNVSGKLNGKIEVNVDETGCNPIVIEELYGGGNFAAYSVYGYEGTDPRTKEQYDAMTDEQKADEGLTTPRTNPLVNIISCTRIGNVFGGGYGATAVMVGDPTVTINQIPGAHAAAIDNKLGAIGTVYGGGNAAKVIGKTYVNVGTTAQNAHKQNAAGTIDTTTYDAGANIIGNIYGGGKNADVTDKTNVTIGQ